MVQHTDTHMGIHTHMGEARVLAHTCIWAASTRMGCPYAYGAAHTRIWAEYLYGTEQRHFGYPNT